MRACPAFFHSPKEWSFSTLWAWVLVTDKVSAAVSSRPHAGQYPHVHFLSPFGGVGSADEAELRIRTSSIRTRPSGRIFISVFFLIIFPPLLPKRAGAVHKAGKTFGRFALCRLHRTGLFAKVVKELHLTPPLLPPPLTPPYQGGENNSSQPPPSTGGQEGIKIIPIIFTPTLPPPLRGRN